MSRRLPLVLLASALLSGPALAIGEGVAPVDACMRDNLPKKTSKQTIDLTSTDRTGGTRTLKAEVHWQQVEKSLARTLMEVEAPPADRGSRYLWLEHEDRNDTWVCLPELQRVRRIHESSGEGALFGSDFSYEDVQHVKRISKPNASKRLPDTMLAGREVYIVHADTSKEEGSAYDRILYSIDKETCLPLQIEFFDTPENRLKVLKSDPESFSREGDGWVARSVSIENLAAETASVLTVEEIEVDVEIPDRMFSLSYLERRCR
jgi:outer membrane lipoprotein-sorting protein